MKPLSLGQAARIQKQKPASVSPPARPCAHPYGTAKAPPPEKKTRHTGSLIVRALVLAAAAMTFGVLIFLIVYILVNGIPHLKLSLFSFTYDSNNVSMFPAIVNTIAITALSLLIAIPFGIFTAIYLVEYAGRGIKY